MHSHFSCPLNMSQFRRLGTILLFCFFVFSAFSVERRSQNLESNFRPGHNLHLLLSLERSTWTLSRKEKEIEIAPEYSIQKLNSTRYTLPIYFRYTNHLNIVSFFGLIIGSTIGFIPTRSYSQEDILNLGPGFLFPTILLGFSLNAFEKFRFQLTGEYGAIYYPYSSIKEKDLDTGYLKHASLSLTPDMLNSSVSVEYFHEKNRAYMAQAGYRYILSPCLNRCTDNSYINNLNIKNESFYLQFGLTWYLSGFVN